MHRSVLTASVAGAALTLMFLLLVVASGSNQAPVVVRAQTMDDSAMPPKNPNCSPDVVPTGQANPSAEPEPMAPIWCFSPLNPVPTTRVTGANDWVDTFQTDSQMGALNDGAMGYRVFNNLDPSGNVGDSPVRTQQFVNSGHWMVDAAGSRGGAAISPNRSFRFEGGKLVLEADVAAGIPGYGTEGDIVWPEVVWSTAAAPTGEVADNLYLYGQFGGQWASGCRLSARRGLTCTLQANRSISNANGNSEPCFSVEPSRLWEISGFQRCGRTHSGGSVDFGGPADAWRLCKPNQMDMYCRDRFRLEWTKSSLTVFVNGVKFMEDSGWPADRQIPDAIASGAVPVYAYFGQWGSLDDGPAFRFHWGRVAVNPRTSNGALAGPSAAPTYCRGMPQNTCAMDHGSGSDPGMATPTAASTRPPATATAPAAATATRTPTQAPATFTTSAKVAPAAVAPGSTATIAASVRPAAAGRYLVDVEVYSPSGAKVHQQFWDSQAFSAGQARTFGTTWTAPANALAGTYRVVVGVFSPGWGALLHWNDEAGQFSVGPGAAATATPTTAATQPPATPTPAEARALTIRFDDRGGQDEALNGQYPTGVINWVRDKWYLSSPLEKLTTKNLTLNGKGGVTRAAFTFVKPKKLVKLDAYNSGSRVSTVTLSCTGQSSGSVTIQPRQLVTIETGWTGPCTAVTLSSSNGWETSFDNLVIQ